MKQALVGLAAVSMLACASRPAPSALDGLAPDQVLPAIERRLGGARSVRVQFDVERTYDFGGLSVAAMAVRLFLPGDSRGSLTVLRNGGYALSDGVSIAGSTLPIELISDGSKVRVSGGFPGRTRNATTVERPGAREHVLKWLVLKGAEVGVDVDGGPEDRLDAASGFSATGAKLGSIRKAGPHHKPARSLTYTLHQPGSTADAEVTLWIDVKSGLPVRRETVVRGEPGRDGRETRTITRESYEITLDGDAPESFYVPGEPEPAEVPAVAHTPIAAEALYKEMERKLVEARSLELDMMSEGNRVRLYLEGLDRVWLRAPRLTIRSDLANLVYAEDGARSTTSVPAPPSVTRQMATAFARGGYGNLSDVLRTGLVNAGKWHGTSLTKFRWLWSEKVRGRPADVIRYVFEGPGASNTECTLWIDSEKRLPIMRSISRSPSPGSTTEVYSVIRLNATFDPRSWDEEATTP